MGLNRTEIDEVTGGTIYYIDEGKTGILKTLKMSDNDEKNNKKILKTIGRVGGTRWTDTYSKKGTEYVRIWGDRDVAEIEDYVFGRDTLMFTSKSLAKSISPFPSIAGSGTFLASGNNIIASLSGINVNDFAAMGGYFYE